MSNDLEKSAVVVTNELRLHDFANAKMSVTFGENPEKLLGGYSYLNLGFTASETKVNMVWDRETLNFAGPTEITLNDLKIWNETNDGPNSGLNADLLDGRHATEFKDRYGYHHFLHQFTPPSALTGQNKHFVKIATFNTRKVGNAPDFNTDGTPPYNGTFQYSGNGVMGTSPNDIVTHGGNLNNIMASLAVSDAKAQFKISTPLQLDEHEPDLFHTTGLLTNGIYNGTLRGCVSILKGKRPTTFDFHVGLFEDPLCTEKDGWEAVDKYFYVSLHDETLPFLNEPDWNLTTNNDPNHTNSGIPTGQNVNENTDDLTRKNGTYRDGYPNYPARLKFTTVPSNVYYVKPTNEKLIEINNFKKKYNGDVVTAMKAQIDNLIKLNPELNKEDINEENFGEVAMATMKSSSLSPDKDTPQMTPHKTDPRSHMPTAHARPVANRSTYAKPPARYEETNPYATQRKREQFPAPNATDQGDSYQQFIDIMRLYHTSSRVDMVDNVEVHTHTFELYMCVDEKMEVRIQPYMSTACLLHNYEPPLQEGDLPQRKFIRPKSIYDNRYAHVRHRHYDYEKRIWQLTLEVEKIWEQFKYYVTIDQGVANANKVMMTDDAGKIYAAEDNMERHAEEKNKRPADRVLVTQEHTVTLNGVAQRLSCIVTSFITTDELAQLQGIDGNIQDQIDNIWDVIDDIYDELNDLWDALEDLEGRVDAIENELPTFVKKTGDTMTGSLHIQYDGKTYTDGNPGPKPETFSGIKFFNKSNPTHNGGYLYGATRETAIGLGVQKNAGSDREADWAIKMSANQLDAGVGFQMNGTKIRFTKNGWSGRGTTKTCDLDLADVFRVVNGGEPW